MRSEHKYNLKNNTKIISGPIYFLDKFAEIILCENHF